MNLEKRMEDLLGASFTRNGEHEVLNNYRYANGIWTVSTSKKDRRMPSERLNEWLQEITVDESTIGKHVSVIPKAQAKVLTEAESSFCSINDMIMQNLRKLNNSEKLDPDDLARAKATNEGAKAISEMAKVQLDIIKETRK